MQKRKASRSKEATGIEDLGARGLKDTAGPVPENASKFRLRFQSKLILVIFVFLLLGLLIILGKSPKSNLTVSPQNYKFKTSIKLAPKDQENLQKFQQKLKIPKDITSGFEFELDSTSSAKLAFASPVILDLSVEEDSISFSGTSHLPIIDTKLPDPSSQRLPKNTSVAVYAESLLPLILKNTGVEENLRAQYGQFLVIFGDDEFFLSFQTRENVDFTSLEKLVQEGGYKQETSAEIIIHLVKIPSDRTLAFFQDQKRAYIASSLSAARQIIALKDDSIPHLNFPKTQGDVSLAIFAKQNDATNANTLEIFSPDAQVFGPYLKEIREALLVFDAEKIYGYVDF